MYKVDPNDPKKTKYFRMNISELLYGSKNKLPGIENGIFLVLIDYIRDVTHTHQQINKEQIMFYVLRGSKRGNYDQEEESKILTEIVVNQILQKMIKDSKDGHQFFNHAFDKADKVRIVSQRIPSNIDYIGWQVSFKMPSFFNDCYNQSDWK